MGTLFDHLLDAKNVVLFRSSARGMPWSYTGSSTTAMVLRCVRCYRIVSFDVSGVTGQSIPPGRIIPGVKAPWLDYTRVCYGLGQFILRSILWPRPIHTTSGQIIHP